MAVNRDRNVDTMGNTEENQLGVSHERAITINR
jgi:hypothetical protein